MANRFKIFLPTVISKKQRTFVKERLITDNTMITYEVLHAIKNKRQDQEGQCRVKLDMCKA